MKRFWFLSFVVVVIMSRGAWAQASLTLEDADFNEVPPGSTESVDTPSKPSHDMPSIRGFRLYMTPKGSGSSTLTTVTVNETANPSVTTALKVVDVGLGKARSLGFDLDTGNGPHALNNTDYYKVIPGHDYRVTFDAILLGGPQNTLQLVTAQINAVNGTTDPSTTLPLVQPRPYTASLTSVWTTYTVTFTASTGAVYGNINTFPSEDGATMSYEITHFTITDMTVAPGAKSAPSSPSQP